MTAESADPVTKPQDREKCLSVAYLRILGASQIDAAKVVGVGERSVRNWEACSWWPAIKAEATDRWLDGLRSKTFVALERLVEDLEPTTVRFVAERIEDRFLPPKQRVEATGANGGPIEYRDLSDEELKARAARLHNRVAGAFPSTAGKP